MDAKLTFPWEGEVFPHQTEFPLMPMDRITCIIIRFFCKSTVISHHHSHLTAFSALQPHCVKQQPLRLGSDNPWQLQHSTEKAFSHLFCLFQNLKNKQTFLTAFSHYDQSHLQKIYTCSQTKVSLIRFGLVVYIGVASVNSSSREFHICSPGSLPKEFRQNFKNVYYLLYRGQTSSPRNSVHCISVTGPIHLGKFLSPRGTLHILRISACQAVFLTYKLCNWPVWEAL